MASLMPPGALFPSSSCSQCVCEEGGLADVASEPSGHPNPVEAKPRSPQVHQSGRAREQRIASTSQGPPHARQAFLSRRRRRHRHLAAAATAASPPPNPRQPNAMAGSKPIKLGFRSTAIEALRGADLTGKVAVVTGVWAHGRHDWCRLGALCNQTGWASDALA